MTSIAQAIAAAKSQYPAPTSQKDKKNFAEAFSRHLATVFANQLRPRFPGILPDEHGKRQESRARTSHGFKKLDVNYSTLELGLALGISIKTINARDPATKRYTKNYTRVDNELRAEATDYHKRQPFSVLAAIILLPIDACDDAASDAKGASSFGAACRIFRRRANRSAPKNDFDLFERVFVGVYDATSGDCAFHDVMSPPPRNRRLTETEVLSLDAIIESVLRAYENRNEPPFQWAP